MVEMNKISFKLCLNAVQPQGGLPFYNLDKTGDYAATGIILGR